MKLTVLEVVRRVEGALERVTHERGQFAWQVDYAEVLLWVRVQPDGASGVVVTRRPGGEFGGRGEVRSVLSLLPAPFRGSKLVCDYLASRPLISAIETMLHTVNSVSGDGDGFSLATAEVHVNLIVESSGELRVSYDAGVQISRSIHTLLVSFSKAHPNQPKS